MAPFLQTINSNCQIYYHMEKNRAVNQLHGLEIVKIQNMNGAEVNRGSFKGIRCSKIGLCLLQPSPSYFRFNASHAVILEWNGNSLFANAGVREVGLNKMEESKVEPKDTEDVLALESSALCVDIQGHTASK